MSSGRDRRALGSEATSRGTGAVPSRLDPEEVHAILERFFGIVDAVVESYGGADDRTIEVKLKKPFPLLLMVSATSIFLFQVITFEQTLLRNIPDISFNNRL